MGIVRAVELARQKSLVLSGMQSRFIDTNQGRQHYYELAGRGDLPLIVLIHGIGASASGYAPLMRHLQNTARRIIALDFAGHGLSEPLRSGAGHNAVFDVGCDVLRQIMREPGVVFGNSLGGAFSVEFSLRHPELVAGLILCSPAGTPMAQNELDAFLPSFALDTFGKAHTFAKRIFARAPWYTFLIAPVVQQIFASVTIKGILANLAADEGITRAQLHTLHMPLLLLWGKLDHLMPANHLRFYRDNLPSHAQIEEPEDFGHCPQMDNPRDVRDRIVDFASRLSLGNRSSTSNKQVSA